MKPNVRLEYVRRKPERRKQSRRKDEPDFAIDVDTDTYIQELVRANVKLIQENAELKTYLMKVDRRAQEKGRIGRWLEPDPHLAAENAGLRAKVDLLDQVNGNLQTKLNKLRFVKE